jgi:hypothetical protein
MNNPSRSAVLRALVWGFAFASMCIVGGHASTADAGVVTLSSSSSIKVSGASDQGSYDEQAASDTVGELDQLSLERSVGSGQSLTGSSARLDSFVLPGNAGLGVTASGEVRGQVAEIGGQSAFAESLLEVKFRVTDRVERFKVSGRLDGTAGGEARVELANDDTQQVLFRELVETGIPESIPYEVTGGFLPGNYTATFRAMVSGTPLPESAAFTANFSVGTNPIPLPPAVLTGLATLAPVALVIWRFRRARS